MSITAAKISRATLTWTEPILRIAPANIIELTDQTQAVSSALNSPINLDIL
jgi:hypothetical protein